MWYAVYALLLGVSWIISLYWTRRAIDLAQWWGYMDTPGERKVHSTAKPRLGGLGICIGFFSSLLAAVAAAALFPLSALPSPLAEFAEQHRAGIAGEWKALLGLVVGGALIFTGGLLDDRKNLSPGGKLVWQFSAACVAIAAGYRLDLFAPNPAMELLVSIPATLVWMIFLVNAFNLLDNMDGLSAGVAAITTTFFALYAHWQHEFFLAASMACLVGALLGFLRYNWSPSRIFMGDGGALLVGFLIACFTCRCTYYQMEPESIFEWLFPSGMEKPGQGIFSVLTPLVIMAVPIFDTSTVVFIRWRRGKPIMTGDTNHFSHRLVALGLSQKLAVEVIYLVTIFTGLGALILQSASVAQAILVFLQVLSVFLMILLLERVRGQ
jgi:UDP-GlcNAc:undecaprenyl-phosphate GlcNAc-1-phosphate transferase